MALRILLPGLGLLSGIAQALTLPSGSSYGVPGNASYDYVVVGGGTAGLTVATRLAQDGRFSVAVIEAGGFYEIENGNHSVIPGYAFYGLAVPSNPLVEWGFVTEPQTGYKNRTMPYVRGRTLGGSSAFNYMVYQRPTIGTLQKWGDEVGDDSWTWSNVLKYYARSATFTPPTPGSRPANATPGYDTSVFANGPVQASYSPFSFPVSGWLLKASQALGIPYLSSGFESGRLLGNSWAPASISPKTGERSSSEQAYLQLGLETQQLTVYTHSLAKKILFNGITATGVQVQTGSLPFTLTAKKEVIVSCGAFQSPQLLMVSGIGSSKVLRNLSIPVIADRPGVGQNMWDNPIFGITYAVDVGSASPYQSNPGLLDQAVNQYNNNRTGYLTSAGAETISFEALRNLPDSANLNLSSRAKQDLSTFPADWPDVQFWSLAQWYGPFLGSTPPTTLDYETIAPGLTAPLSRGYVSINSTDMADPPIINPNWLTNPTDQELAIAAVRRAREYAATPIFKSITIGEEAYPGKNVSSDAQILSFLQDQAGTFYHASATNKMGRRNDSMAVVDSKARVIGASNLRVVDISAFPFLPPGQPQATVYMLAEKIADEILNRANSTSGNATFALT